MALTQTLAQMRSNVRKFANVGGTTALQRHPDADLNDYINRGLGSVYRKLTEALPDQRYLSTSTVSLSSGTTSYSLPSDFDHLISIDLTANGVKTWLEGYQMHERAALTDPSASFSGVPFTYRLRGSNIEYLPSPTASYTSTLWYVPTATSLSSDAQTWDTIDRLDDYVVAYAARLVATKDKALDIVAVASQLLAELTADIAALSSKRDKNSPPRIVDVTMASRWGSSRWRRR